MRPRAKPVVNFFTQVSIETDERRRRLQQRTGYSVPRLVDEALRELETKLDGDRDHRSSRRGASVQPGNKMMPPAFGLRPRPLEVHQGRSAQACNNRSIKSALTSYDTPVELEPEPHGARGPLSLAAAGPRNEHRGAAVTMQLNLFASSANSQGSAPAPIDPLHGLSAQLSDTCQCGSHDAVIGEGKGPHAASLFCNGCERHRGWMANEIHLFVAEIVKKFGKPTTPIRIQRKKREEDQKCT